uniref:Uncharacterized protein n=1 Tax=Nelumbo nucifera TaxID=4432 RepID=A0A822ZKG4_NELNU|nr:TPA_asm: hypothetical protein HUJ06_001726 [Nelumbo nucifera]
MTKKTHFKEQYYIEPDNESHYTSTALPHTKNLTQLLSCLLLGWGGGINSILQTLHYNTHS